MRILALDLSTRIGWARSSLGVLTWGEHRLVQTKGQPGALRFHDFTHWLEAQLYPLGHGTAPYLDVVAYEEPHLRGRAATHLCVGLSTRVEEWCARSTRWVGGKPNEGGHSAPVTCLGIHSRTLKTYAGAQGAGKEHMVKAAHLRLVEQGHGSHQLTDNEADALWLLWYVQQWVEGGMKA